MKYGPVSESPSRLQRTVLGSHALTSIAIGGTGAVIGLVIALARQGPSLALLIVCPAFALLAALGVYFFHPAKHQTREERLQDIVAYPRGFSIPPARTARERRLAWASVVVLLVFGIVRLTQLIGSPATAGDIGIVMLDLVALAVASARLRRGSSTEG